MGIFVTLEGPDGAGKTTQLEMLKPIAEDRGWLLTRNPGGTNFGLKLREILLNDQSVRLNPLAELFLYMADRAQNIEEVVKPSLDKTVVICDRFIDSTVAYQGYARGLNTELIHQLNEVAIQGVQPDITFLLDVDPGIGLSRSKKRSGESDKMESEGILFQDKVRKGFLKLAEQNKERFLVIDTVKYTPDKVHKIIISKINEKLNSKI
ncbi:MAG: dTMP kinase [Candidatus Caenarcaniphilales bacterium]|nr:dTMP kinase [Candidatus Caenarcaniphilales bacterium]